jgi:uncharacterized small protein (DUF1192 family)
MADKFRETRDMARDMLRGSIVEDAAAQFLAQIVEHIHETRIAPLKTAIEAKDAEIARLREARGAAAALLAVEFTKIAPKVLNAVAEERVRWGDNPAVKRGEVPTEMITLSMFKACLRALAEDDTPGEKEGGDG